MTPDPLAAVFDAVTPFTVGLEEEAMLLDAETLAPADRAAELIARVGTSPATAKLELPACQIELTSRPRATVAAAIDDLAAGRRTVLAAGGEELRPAAAGVHPFAPAEGGLNGGPRYDKAAATYRWAARRQQVCALQVHVAVGGAERTVAVHDALRAELPALAALAGNAPIYGGRDTGLASVRPALCRLLPRQGIPPALGSVQQLRADLAWGAASGAVPEPGFWWWELRPHPRHGTLELRVPDAQTTLADAAAVAAVAHCLVVELAQRHGAGERWPELPSWRLEENRFAACRDGVAATFADPVSGARVAAGDHLLALIERLAPVARELGCATELAGARRLVAANGAVAQRAVAHERGARGLAGWLADRYADGVAPADAAAPAEPVAAAR